MRGPSPYLSHGLLALAVIGLLGLIVWAGRQGRPRPGPQAVLFQYTALFRWLTYLAACGMPIGLTVFVLIYRPGPDARPYIFGMYLLFACLTVPLVWEASRFYLFVNLHGLECRSPWRGVRFFAWDDIRLVRYSAANSWFVFMSESGDAIRVSGFVAGLTRLLGMVESHLPTRALKDARPGYERLGRPFPAQMDEPILEALPPRA